MSAWLWRDALPQEERGIAAAVIRIVASLALALALLFGVREARILTIAFATWVAVFGAVAVAGPLYQRLVPDGAGMYVLIEPVSFGSALASEIALIVTLAALLLRGDSRGSAALGTRR
jgi:hypothetical protein